MIRQPHVAGAFYEGSEEALLDQVKKYIPPTGQRVSAVGCVSPHAGYVYSGRIAGKVLSAMAPSRIYVILGTKHTRFGSEFGMDHARSWNTPLGDCVIDNSLVEDIAAASRLIEKDSLCHNEEHSIEVQLPFLQVLSPGFTFVPITIGQGSIEDYRQAGSDIASALKKSGRRAVIIASTDMTHYEPEASAKKKDMLVIERMLALDIDGFFRDIVRNNVSMCGYAPTAVMMAASRDMGAKHTKLIGYETSAAASGDSSSVVGYAGMVVY